MSAVERTRTGSPRGRTTRGQGQWALGYREPLNPNERAKRDSDGLEVRQRIIDIYSKGGFDSIDPGDLRGRFRWFGLYTQRAPGIPGGRTAVLEPEELEDRYFMLRIRIDGGQLTSEQLDVIGQIATTYGRDVADITDRQNVQLHWIEVEDVPAIWEKLEAVGLSTTEACGDTPRVIVSGPLEDVAADQVIDGTAPIKVITDRYLGDPQFSNLPRKFKTSVSGDPRQSSNPEINDISFVGVIGPDGEPGYDLWIGGGLSTNPMFAKRVGVFVTEAEVPDVWAAVCSLFRDYGYRRSRNHARIKFLMADWGPEKFRQVLQDEFLHRELPDGPAPAPAPAHRDHIGLIPQKDGLTAIGATTKSGRTSGTALSGVAKLARAHGARGGRIRTTAQQGLLVLDIAPADADAVADELERLGLSARPSVFHRGTIACTGIEFCKLAIVETKGRAEQIRTELEKRLPDFDTPLTVNVNGCPNSCARFQVADIGFKGIVQKVEQPDGSFVDAEAFQIHLGGQLGAEASFGRKFRGLKVTADEAADYAERVLRGFLERRTEGESFASYVQRAEEDWLL